MAPLRSGHNKPHKNYHKDKPLSIEIKIKNKQFMTQSQLIDDNTVYSCDNFQSFLVAMKLKTQGVYKLFQI